jgi:tetratricopeptide (TPR) repeat protein
LSLSLNNVADIEKARGDLDAALSKYEESLSIRRALADELGTPQSRRHVLISLSSVAEIEQARGDLEASLSKYEESLSIARAHCEELGTPVSHHDVSICLSKLARIEESRGNRNAALSRYEESLSIARALAHELGTPYSRRDLSDALDNVARIEEDQGALDSALAKYEESLSIARSLFDTEEPHETVLSAAEAGNGLVWTSCLLARCASRLGRADVALDRLVAAEAFLARLEHPEIADANLLDTAATWHEQRSEVAGVQADATLYEHHRAKGAALRERIRQIKCQPQDQS